MELEEFARQLLGNQCPAGDPREDKVYLYDFELHCSYVYVVAQTIEIDDGYNYNILYVDFQ